MKFPKVAELRNIHRKAIESRKMSFYDENKALVDSIVNDIGKSLFAMAEAGQNFCHYSLVDKGGLTVFNPVMNREEFESLVQIVNERLEEWDSFLVQGDYDSRHIVVRWSV